MVNNKQDKLSTEIKVSIEGGVTFVEHSDAYKAQNERYLNNETFTAEEKKVNRKLIESEEAQMEAAKKDPIEFLRNQQKTKAVEYVEKLKDNLTAAGQSEEQQIAIMKLMAENSKINADRLQGKSPQEETSKVEPSKLKEANQDNPEDMKKSTALPPPLDIQRAVVGEGINQISATGSTSIEGGGFQGGLDYSRGFKHFQAGFGAGSDDQGAMNVNAHAEKVIPVKLPVLGDTVAYPYVNAGGAGVNTDKAALNVSGGALIVKNSELDLLGTKVATATYVGGQVNQEGNVNAYASSSVALSKDLTIATGVNYDVAAKNLTESLEVLFKVSKDVQLSAKLTTDEGKDNTISGGMNYRFGGDGPSL